MYVEVGRPGPRVTALSVSSSDPNGLTSANFPDIDLAAVVEALASRFLVQKGRQQLKLSDNRSESSPAGYHEVDSVELVKAVDDYEESRSAGSRRAELVDSAEPAAGRAYRKMPDADELRENFHKIGTVTGLARHYNVPRHTAQGWVGRLRKLTTAPENV
ncbi:hypothetical protein IU450_36705 [Nocardia abscessus]|uniref:hypothetical protein n=1 Tax=Nocardia abscessus TaxID=120957 RepID=UPI00189514E5|nr:hypothetical protein [Nocardia abscessus]MBF6341381.1 hypothetical protein [Nocardia abscessus]